MSAPDLESLHPDVLAAFFGKASLASAQSHFSSWAALLKAYGDMQSSVFGRDTASREHCDVCGQRWPPAERLVVVWTARSRWCRNGVLLRVFVFPLVFPIDGVLGHFGVPSLIDKIAARIPFEERIEFATSHPVCQACARRQRFRGILHHLARYLCLFVGVFFAMAALVLFAITAEDLFSGRDLLLNGLAIIVPLGLAMLTGYAGKQLVPRILLPRGVGQLIKPPFHRRQCEVLRL